MNKPEIITAFSDKTGHSKAEVIKILDELTEFITETLTSGETIKLVGLMELGVKVRKERNGVNPATKEKIVIPASKVPYVKFGKVLKESVK